MVKMKYESLQELHLMENLVPGEFDPAELELTLAERQAAADQQFAPHADKVEAPK